MKLTKKVLKSVVKECLLEIFSEGFSASKVSSKRDFEEVVNEVAVPRTKTADLIQFQKRVKETSNSLTEDPVLSSIFEDTAMTTLQEQKAAPGHVSAVDRAAYQSSVSDPTDIFGESAGKWAALAFSDSNKN
jgi:hypothetical protein